MKKRILFTIMVFTSMFFGVPNVFASTTITQADFDAAKGGTPTNGVSYIESGGHKWYNLTTDEEFIFDSDINLGDAQLLYVGYNGSTYYDIDTNFHTGRKLCPVISLVPGILDNATGKGTEKDPLILK